MSGHEFQSHFSDADSGVDFDDQSTNITEHTIEEMRAIAARYPQKHSAVLPMLHLVQSVDGRVSPAGIRIIAELVGQTEAQITGVATFYTMYKRRPAGEHHVGVCTTTTCAVLGGDILMSCMEKKLGISEGQTTPDGKISLERLECNAACDYAPVMMVNWEFFDNMTPQKADELIDALVQGQEVQSPRGATITSWKEAERVIAGFPDGRADEGPAGGEPSLRGTRIAQEQGWTAPNPAEIPAPTQEEAK
ncbi:NADH-quinone oxidoreductase subunit NuoE [Luteococcus sp. Sow4_B9]|uniref:NADH-quinone oxidoreductase subunit NuoE n=1 Tax=Luteococcus sp. Sow4_B9 TaxID=3438792 RepID=UPI003F998171